MNYRTKETLEEVARSKFWAASFMVGVSSSLALFCFGSDPVPSIVLGAIIAAMSRVTIELGRLMR